MPSLVNLVVTNGTGTGVIAHSPVPISEHFLYEKKLNPPFPLLSILALSRTCVQHPLPFYSMRALLCLGQQGARDRLFSPLTVLCVQPQSSVTIAVYLMVRITVILTITSYTDALTPKKGLTYH